MKRSRVTTCNFKGEPFQDEGSIGTVLVFSLTITGAVASQW